MPFGSFEISYEIEKCEWCVFCELRTGFMAAFVRGTSDFEIGTHLKTDDLE